MGAGVKDTMNVGEPPSDDTPIEQPGTKLKVRGRVEGHYRGGAVVQFPTPTGGAVGIPSALEGLKVGDPATLEATVTEATREVIRVTFETPDGQGQAAELSRFRCTIE